LGEPNAADHQGKRDGVIGGERLADQADGERGGKYRNEIDEHPGASRSDQVDAAQIEDLGKE
jgi:hypothetical protein